MSRSVLYALAIAVIIQMVFLFFPLSAEAHIGAGIVVDRAGRVYFLDTSRNRVWMVDTEGKPRLVAEHKHSDALAIGADGNIYFEDVISGGVWKITPEGSVSEVLPKSKRSAAVGWTYFLTIGADGSFYFVSGYPDQVRLLKMDLSGNATILAGSTRGTADGPVRETQFREVRAAAWGTDGALYLIDGDSIRKLSADGAVTTLAGGPEGGFADGEGATARFRHPSGLALDAQGNIFVADSHNRRIRKVTPAGEVSSVLYAGSLWSPAGVAVTGDVLYAIERFGIYNGPSIFFSWIFDLYGNPRVRRIASDGDSTKLAAVRGLSPFGWMMVGLQLVVLSALAALIWIAFRLLRGFRARRQRAPVAA